MMSSLVSSPSSSTKSVIDDDHWQKVIRQLVQPLPSGDTPSATTILNQPDEKQLMIESIVDDAYTMYERLDLQQPNNSSYQGTSDCTDDANEDMNQNNSDDPLGSHSGTEEITTSGTSIASQMEYILQQLYIGCRNPQLPVRDRRKAFDALNQLILNLQQYSIVHHKYEKHNNDNTQCSSLQVLVLPTESTRILETLVTSIPANNTQLNGTEESSVVHTMTLPQVLPGSSTINVDGSNYQDQSTASQSINVPKSSNTNSRSAKRTKLNNNHPYDTKITTDVVMEDKVKVMEHTDVFLAVSELPHATATTTTAIIHPNPISQSQQYQHQQPNDVHYVAMSSTMIDPTVIAKNIPIQSTPPPDGIVLSQPPPRPPPSSSESESESILLLSGMAKSTLADAATPAIESVETEVVSVQIQNQPTPNIVVAFVEEEKNNNHNVDGHVSITGFIQRQPYHLRILFWYIIISLLQIIAYPILIPILPSFSPRTSTNSRHRFNESKMENGDVIFNVIQSTQQLQQELQMSMQQEQLMRQSIDLALADHFNTTTIVVGLVLT